jgi:hypothetical protein
VWINSGDIILLGLRDYQDTKADVILKYTADEARNLKAYGELPESGTFRFCFVFVMDLTWGSVLYVVTVKPSKYLQYAQGKHEAKNFISGWD